MNNQKILDFLSQPKVRFGLGRLETIERKDTEADYANQDDWKINRALFRLKCP